MAELELTTRLAFQLSANFYGAADDAAASALNYFQSIEQGVFDSVQSRMRDGGRGGGEDTERGNLKSLTVGGDFPALWLYGDLIQTVVDEYGATWPDKMPPWREGSDLFAWVASHDFGVGGLLESQRRALGQLLGRGASASEEEQATKRTESISYLIARAIQTRGLPAPTDYLHAPFHSAFLEWQEEVVAALSQIGYEVAARRVGG